MTSLFDTEDLDLLLDLYHELPATGRTRRPPWTWPTLTPREAAALTRLLDTFITHYNHTYATTRDQLIPLCWPHHPALAHDLAAHLWLWYAIHHDPVMTAHHVSEYHLRHLPAFQNRILNHLGRSPIECQTDQHPATWRTHNQQPTPPTRDHAIRDLTTHNFGFSA